MGCLGLLLRFASLYRFNFQRRVGHRFWLLRRRFPYVLFFPCFSTIGYLLLLFPQGRVFCVGSSAIWFPQRFFCGSGSWAPCLLLEWVGMRASRFSFGAFFSISPPAPARPNEKGGPFAKPPVFFLLGGFLAQSVWDVITHVFSRVAFDLGVSCCAFSRIFVWVYRAATFVAFPGLSPLSVFWHILARIQ